MSGDINSFFGEMSFDSSLHNNMDKSLSASEYKHKIVDLVQPILDERFPDQFSKRQVHVHHDRIAIACPYCGDSMKNAGKKRGNFILTGKHQNFYKCHNCGEFKRIDQFFKEFKVDLQLDTINYIMANIGDFTSQGNTKYDMSVLIDMTPIEKYAVDRELFKQKTNTVEVKGSSIWNWLVKRLQYDESKFLYNESLNQLYILNLTQDGKILGTQKRLFKGNSRFETYKLSKIYSDLLGDILLTNEEQTQYLDVLSMTFNICLLDFNKPVTLFEGPMDAFMFRNSIANTGANKELPLDIPVRYWYDSDETGKRKSLEHIGKNHSVFLWDKFTNNFGMTPRLKWDLNDVLIYFKENNIKIPPFNNYFSDDPLDAIDI